LHSERRATLQFESINATYTYTIGSLSGAGLVKGGNETFSVQTNTLQVGSAGTSTAFSGQIANYDSDALLALSKIGAGTLTLTGTDSSYSGATTISGGVLSVQSVADGGSNSSIGAGSSIVFDGGTLQYANTGVDGSTNRNVTLNAGGGTIDVATAGRTLSLTGTLAGTGGLTKAGAGTLTLTGTNTYTGSTSIQGGTLRADDGVGLPVASHLDFSGGILATHGTFTRSIGTAPGQVKFLGSTNGFSAAGGDLTVNLGNNAGTWAFDNSTNLTLVLNTAAPTGNVTVLNRIVYLDGVPRTVTVGANTATFADGVTANAGLIKEGPGTLVLAGSSGYGGATDVNAGTLRVAGTLSCPLVNLNAGGTLAGSGTVSALVSVNAGGTIAPGNSIGQLTVASTAFNPTGKLAVEFNASVLTPTSGMDNDLLLGRPGATLDLSALSATNKFAITLTHVGTGLPTGVPTAYTVAQYDTITGAAPGDVSNLFTLSGDFSGTPTVSLLDGPTSDSLVVAFSPVPEPVGLFVIAAGLFAAASYRWLNGGACDARPHGWPLDRKVPRPKMRLMLLNGSQL
jgi:fibronectin-binding autotransporter adhesin